MVGDQLGHHFDQRRALLGEVGVGPRLARRVGVVRVAVTVRVKSRLSLGFGFGSRYLNYSVPSCARRNHTSNTTTA